MSKNISAAKNTKIHTKHTPGPWTLTHAHGETYVSNNLPGGWIADLGNLLCGKDKARRAQNEADARLIASAPDLLAICEQIEFHCPQGEIKPDERYTVSLLGAQIHALRAAIAKARGEQ